VITYLIKPYLALNLPLGILRNKSGSSLLSKKQTDFFISLSNRPIFPLDLREHPWLLPYVIEDRLNNSSKRRKTFIDSELLGCEKEQAHFVLVRARKAKLIWEDFSIELAGERFLFRSHLLGNIEGDFKLSFYKRLDFNSLRDQWVLKIISRNNIQSLLDLGCGTTERFSLRLKKQMPGVHYAGVDQQTSTHGVAANFIDPTFQVPSSQACLLEEVIEHLSSDQLDVLMEKLFHQSIKQVIITTPNFSFSKYLGRHFRHSDHQFEWNERELLIWLDKIRERYGYCYFYRRIGRSYGGHAPTWGIYLWKT